MLEKFNKRRSAISAVVRFPVRRRMILGGNPLSDAMSEKSASKVTTVKPFLPANCHILRSSQSFKPTDCTWRQSAKLSGRKRSMRYEIFWSNSSFMSNKLDNPFPSGCKGKTGKNIFARQFRKINKNFIVTHSCRQPPQYIINRDAGFPDARLAKTLVGINSDDIVFFGLDNFLFDDLRTQKYKKYFFKKNISK